MICASEPICGYHLYPSVFRALEVRQKPFYESKNLACACACALTRQCSALSLTHSLTVLHQQQPRTGRQTDPSSHKSPKVPSQPCPPLNHSLMSQKSQSQKSIPNSSLRRNESLIFDSAPLDRIRKSTHVFRPAREIRTSKKEKSFMRGRDKVFRGERYGWEVQIKYISSFSAATGLTNLYLDFLGVLV
jgi:hypothetical protein